MEIEQIVYIIETAVSQNVDIDRIAASKHAAQTSWRSEDKKCVYMYPTIVNTGRSASDLKIQNLYLHSSN